MVSVCVKVNVCAKVCECVCVCCRVCLSVHCADPSVYDCVTAVYVALMTVLTKDLKMC